MRLTSERYVDTLVIGTGCAGYNAADWLSELGRRNIAVITEGVNMGTSRNTGSDKQTYYKLSLASDGSDSVREMAEDLYAGGGMHGDTALVEAACSVKSFMKLVMLGVPFPTNEYGEYVGYKTDHDPRQRATSCGPLTSKRMTEALERAVYQKGIEIIDHQQVVRLLTEDGAVTGIVAVDTETGAHHVYACDHVVLATGGPAGVYQRSVYPESQTGATGLALEIGAQAQNLCEWQYGLASLQFRWNVSGTYQQVLPRYVSVSPDGKTREFLPEYFKTPVQVLDNIFLKGYQWPFDVRKMNGSSRVDTVVHEEIERGNRVYMDFRTNPTGLEKGFGGLRGILSEEAFRYLENSGALFGTPIERLEKMNAPAVKLYRDHGIDLHKEPLEVAVCAQHCNGGVAVDINWESNIKGLYAVGEAAGTFGVYRPGGSALNATQTGSMRAAEQIARKPEGTERRVTADIWEIPLSDSSNLAEMGAYTRGVMSNKAAFVRNPATLRTLMEELTVLRENFQRDVRIATQNELPAYYKLYDTLTTQIAVLSSMILSAETFGSRGSALVEDERHFCEDPITENAVVITENFVSYRQPVRPIPAGGGWFETVWNRYNTV